MCVVEPSQKSKHNLTIYLTIWGENGKRSPPKPHPLYTRKRFPLQGELASLTKMLYFLINNKPILIRSMMGANIVQATFAGEAVENEGGEKETTGGYFYCYFYWYFYRSG